MPRGSKPGERRGGRQRGTPNKSTLLKNAAIKAAGSDPNLSPLDFLLKLMRQRDLPLEVRVKVAQQTLPFAHSKPKAVRSTKDTYGGSQIGVNVRPGPRVKVVRVKSDDADVDSITPLDFLLGVMRDENSPTPLRLKVTGIVAPYVHPKGEPNEVDETGVEMKVVEDPYVDAHVGDTVESIHQDEQRLRALEPSRENIVKDWQGYLAACRELNKSPAFLELEKTVAEKQATLKCPPNYKELDSRQDRVRIRELEAESKNRPLTTAEEVERKHLRGRLYAYLHANGAFDFRRNSLRPSEELTPEDEQDLRRVMRSLPDPLSIQADQIAPPPCPGLDALRERFKRDNERH